jgi:hypothetical protein
MAKAKKTKKAIKPITHIDSTNARDDLDARVGHFVQAVNGEHQGRYGVLDSVATVGTDGYPSSVVVVTRDDENEYIVVDYADLVPAEAGER